MAPSRWRWCLPSSLLSPPAHWDQPVLLAALFALAVIADRHDVPLPSGITFDARAALSLIAVALAGPLPAFAVIFPPIAVNALLGRDRLLRAGNLANLAAYGWYALAGGLLLELFAPVGAVAARRLAASRGRDPAARQLGGRPGHLRHDVARPPAARARPDAARRAPGRHDHGRARRGHRRALAVARAARARAVRARRRACRRARSRSSRGRARSRGSTRSPPRAATAPRWPSTSGSTATSAASSTP